MTDGLTSDRRLSGGREGTGFTEGGLRCFCLGFPLLVEQHLSSTLHTSASPGLAACLTCQAIESTGGML